MSTTYEELAHLYDIAFSWDVQKEVDWLLERLGPEVRVVLEPACGSGRMFPAFAERGVEVIGIDRSSTMIRRARERMASLGLSRPKITCGDIARFDLHRRADGAICPINSFGYLPDREQARSHFECVARCLKPGARYLLQVDLLDSHEESFSWDSLEEAPPEKASRWEVEQSAVQLRMTWGVIAYDKKRRIQTEVARFEILSGPDAGRTLEDLHCMRVWTWAEWCELIQSSPFRQTAAYDGNRDLSRLPLEQSLEKERLTWHELTLDAA